MASKRTRSPVQVFCIVALLAAAPALGQNINIDVGTLLGTPTAAYGGGAAQPGVWATVNASVTTPQPLIDINGVPTTATLTFGTANGDFSFNNAGTTGDDERLMDDGGDMGGTGATDTITIAHLSAGTYTVYTYAWAPDSAAYITSVNVNGLGAQNVGGPWPGTQTAGITYSTHTNVVIPNDGTITIVTATVTTFSTLNGFQLVGGANNQGRCCDLGGGCAITTEAACTAPNVFAGLGTNCAGDPCRGGCCDSTGFCEVTGPGDCTPPSVFAGFGTTCVGDPCRGRCCTPTGTCSMTNQVNCPAPNSFGGLGTNCDGDPCRGRCCGNDGDCQLTGPAGCTAPAVFAGVGTTCDGTPCMGRCCSAGGTCSVGPVVTCNGTATPGLLNCDAVQVFQFDNVNMVIIDNPPQTPVSNIQTVETNGNVIITDLDVDMNVVHTYPGDVEITLEHLGTSVIIYDRPGVVDGVCCGCFTPNFNIILDDEGTGGAIEDACPGLGGPPAQSPPSFVPNNPLSAFDGLAAAGEWTITSRDYFTADTGTLLSWSLHISSDGPVCPIVGCTCFGDMTGDGAVNGKDIKGFANCVAAGGAGCPCGDMNHAGGATAADVSTFVNRVITGTCGTP